ncbi:cation diffusion facilitator family transporter [Porphyromonadaceae bacterium OttesenSCG-928-L07]|nr:cation diffusion facilitator family transporter [Porphyromonadaceae bacterium OttesenSCG-928-L07]MDL2330975.1 cation diffusion facilitator family transporter [Odoribacter sp. OttesenSCG-928-A06]
MAHEHHHDHHHDHHAINLTSLNKAFIIGIVLNLFFVFVEFGAGLWLDSLALISDAGHNLSDVVSLVIALLAFRLMKLKPNTKYTYGYKKSTILSSLLNACILLVVVGIILAESIKKLSAPEPIEGNMIAWVAGVGIVINAFTAWLFMKDQKKDLNVKGAYLHMVADTLVSVGVVVSGIIIQHTGWYVIDPIISIIIAVIILLSTTGLLFSSVRLALDGVPAGIDPIKIRELIQKEDDRVVEVHHMHIWAISTSENALTAHVVVRSTDGMEELKCKIKHLLEHQEINHVTLEFELEGKSDCDSRGGI